ncbi:MAG: glycosyltransferase family 39 protein [Prevotella sp.]|nr:glycosyltransferase family 39 protein [Prevotella sp.]
MQNSHRTLKRTLSNNAYLIISALFLLLLIAILCIFGYTPTNDGEGYLDYARIALAEHQPYPSPKTILGQPFIWNPGIINLIILSLWAFQSLWPLLLTLCLMKALSAFLVAKIASKLFSHQTALIALFLYILYPNNWGQSTMLSSEIPMVFFTLLAVNLSLKNNNSPRLLRPRRSHIPLQFPAGITLAIANWFRPVATIFLVALVLYHLLKRSRLLRPRRNSTSPILHLLSGYILTILIIGTSCYLRTGYFIYQSDTLWFNMAEATYEKDPQPHYSTEMFPTGTARYIQDMQHKTAIECSHIWRQRSLKWLAEHPAQYLSKIPARLYYVYKNDIDNLSAFLPDKSNPAENYVTLPLKSILHLSKNSLTFREGTTVASLAIITTIFYILLLLSAIIATITTLRTTLHSPLNPQRHFHSEAEKQLSTLNITLLLFIIIAGSLALVLAVHGETRFKAPFMPFIFILAALLKKNR